MGVIRITRYHVYSAIEWKGIYFVKKEVICIFYAIQMRTKKFETRLLLNSNFENYDIELKKYYIRY